MIVAERKAWEIAVEIKNNISINIDEEVSLALLGVNKSVNLQTKNYELNDSLPGKPDQGCMTEQSR